MCVFLLSSFKVQVWFTAAVLVGAQLTLPLCAEDCAR